MSDTIVMIGDIPQQAWEEVLRKRVASAGSDGVRVVRIESDSIEDTLRDLVDPDCEVRTRDPFRYAIGKFCREHNLDPNDVVEAVVLPGWVDDGDGPHYHAFGHPHVDSWPRLSHVTVAHSDGWLEER